MSAAVLTLFSYTLYVSITALALLLIKSLFNGRLSSRWHFFIWGVLLLRLFFPPKPTLFPSDFSLYNLLNPALIIERLRLALPPLPAALPAVVLIVYLAGVALFALFFLISYIRLRLRIRAGTPAPSAVCERVAALAREQRLHPCKRVLCCAGFDSPFICGLFSPVLVLPLSMADDPDDKVLLHELLHFHHCDILLNILLNVLRCLNWFNPLLWFCFGRVSNDCEALCDQRVLERLEGEQRRGYGKLLLSMADHKNNTLVGTTSIANGAGNIKRRISRIVDFKLVPKSLRLVGISIGLIVCMICLCGVSATQNIVLPSSGNLNAALAEARVKRPLTPAGALDAYAKGLLYNNGIYLASAADEEDFAKIEAALYQNLNTTRPDPYYYDGGSVSDLVRFDSYRLPYEVQNLDKQEDGSYLANVVFIHDEYLDNAWAIVHHVRVVPQDGYYTVSFLSKQEAPLNDAQSPELASYQTEGRGYTASISWTTHHTIERMRPDMEQAPQRNAVFEWEWAQLNGTVTFDKEVIGAPAAVSISSAPGNTSLTTRQQLAKSLGLFDWTASGGGSSDGFSVSTVSFPTPQDYADWDGSLFIDSSIDPNRHADSWVFDLYVGGELWDSIPFEKGGA